MTKRPKRPRDPLQLAKMIGDIATGQRAPAPIPKSASVKQPRKGEPVAKRPAKAVPELTTVDADERVLLITRKHHEARAARLAAKRQGRPSTKGS